MAEVQFVVFRLNKEEYGINIMQVQEIGSCPESVKVPNTPDFIEGVINLRGNVIPVINLKKRFNIPGQDLAENARTVIVNLRDKQVAFIVDDASEVLAIDEADIQEPPEIIAGVDRKYITGIGKSGDRLLVILDLDLLFDKQEQEQLAAI